MYNKRKIIAAAVMAGAFVLGSATTAFAKPESTPAGAKKAPPGLVRSAQVVTSPPTTAAPAATTTTTTTTTACKDKSNNGQGDGNAYAYGHCK